MVPLKPGHALDGKQQLVFFHISMMQQMWKEKSVDTCTNKIFRKWPAFDCCLPSTMIRFIAHGQEVRTQIHPKLRRVSDPMQETMKNRLYQQIYER